MRFVGIQGPGPHSGPRGWSKIRLFPKANAPSARHVLWGVPLTLKVLIGSTRMCQHQQQHTKTKVAFSLGSTRMCQHQQKTHNNVGCIKFGVHAQVSVSTKTHKTSMGYNKHRHHNQQKQQTRTHNTTTNSSTRRTKIMKAHNFFPPPRPLSIRRLGSDLGSRIRGSSMHSWRCFALASSSTTT